MDLLLVIARNAFDLSVPLSLCYVHPLPLPPPQVGPSRVPHGLPLLLLSSSSTPQPHHTTSTTPTPSSATSRACHQTASCQTSSWKISDNPTWREDHLAPQEFMWLWPNDICSCLPLRRECNLILVLAPGPVASEIAVGLGPRALYPSYGILIS